MVLLLLNEGGLNLIFVVNLKLIIEFFLQVVEPFNNYELSIYCSNFLAIFLEIFFIFDQNRDLDHWHCLID